MVELISRISKGTLMDQIYIPKLRPIGFDVGSHVAITPVTKKQEVKPYFYNVKSLESIKNIIMQDVLTMLEHAENVIITGSFLDKGMNFNDMDIIVVSEKKYDIDNVKNEIMEKFGIKAHIITMTNKALVKGLETDPLYQSMLNRFAAKKRVIFKVKRRVNYRLLDLHLLKSKLLVDNFDALAGKEKYKLLRNTIAIKFFLDNKKLNLSIIDRFIEDYFKVKVEEIKENIITKEEFLPEYKRLHNEIFNRIMEGVKHGSKQE